MTCASAATPLIFSALAMSSSLATAPVSSRPARKCASRCDGEEDRLAVGIAAGQHADDVVAGAAVLGERDRDVALHRRLSGPAGELLLEPVAVLPGDVDHRDEVVVVLAVVAAESVGVRVPRVRDGAVGHDDAERRREAWPRRRRSSSTSRRARRRRARACRSRRRQRRTRRSCRCRRRPVGATIGPSVPGTPANDEAVIVVPPTFTERALEVPGVDGDGLEAHVGEAHVVELVADVERRLRARRPCRRDGSRAADRSRDSSACPRSSRV